MLQTGAGILRDDCGVGYGSFIQYTGADTVLRRMHEHEAAGSGVLYGFLFTVHWACYAVWLPLGMLCRVAATGHAMPCGCHWACYAVWLPLGMLCRVAATGHAMRCGCHEATRIPTVSFFHSALRMKKGLWG